MAIINIATGLVENVIEIENGADWSCPDGCELSPLDDGAIVGPGFLWDGESFQPPHVPVKSRLEILMTEGPATRIYDEVAESMVDRPAGDIAADKAELLNLLHAKLAASDDLSGQEMNKMLALERES